MRCGFANIVAVMVLLGVFGCKQAPTLSADDGSLFERLLPATATVLKDGRIAGSGAFVTQESHFLTAAHVVDQPEDRIELLLPDGRVVTARTIAVDLGHDLALLETDLGFRSDNQLLGLREEPAPPGTPIVLIGAPSMHQEVLIPGRVGRHRLGFNFLGGRDSYVRSLIITADAAPGTSGGCWVDARGGIVGVQSAFIGDDKGSIGLAFIAPARAAARLIRQRTDQPTATLGGELVGLRTQTHGFIERFPKGSAGVAVHRIFQGGAIDRAGIPADHLITHFDGRPVADVGALYAQVRAHRPGVVVELTVVSPDNHAVKRYPVQLGELKWD